MVDTRVDSSAEAMIRDLKSGEIDVGILWGPMAGYFAKRGQADAPRRAAAQGHRRPAACPTASTMGVRGADQDWKRQLNRLIQENQPEINKMLIGFGVPLLDEKDQPITEESLTKKP